MVTRIIGVGNALVADDDLGPRVCAALARRNVPREIEVIDGGLAGLNLLDLVERSDHVVFVDAVRGRVEDLEFESPHAFGHGTGLSYLLSVLPRVCQGPPPTWEIVGVEGHADDSVVEQIATEALARAARAAFARSGGEEAALARE